MDPELLAQFPVAEAAIEALGLVLWPMVEYEADDAIAAAAERFAADPRVERVVICTPDKDMAQCVRGDRVVLWDRRRDLVYDEAGVRAKWGVPPSSVADRLALVGDAADGFPGLPGWGDKSASAVLARYGTLEAIPAHAGDWDVPGPPRCARPRRHAARAHGRGAAVPRPGPPAHDRRRRADPRGRRGRAPLARADRDRWTAFCDGVGARAAGEPPASLGGRGPGGSARPTSRAGSRPPRERPARHPPHGGLRRWQVRRRRGDCRPARGQRPALRGDRPRLALLVERTRSRPRRARDPGPEPRRPGRELPRCRRGTLRPRGFRGGCRHAPGCPCRASPCPCSLSG